ncbi:HD domain-containing phosphohydrolase [Longimicrobium sp.]|uniref:HD domain-containing phosphohydrolase n=1 Tax=Longimicrobium sp. TaxID=2029185 RepID=UPI002D02B1B3|nr:HD domain-containing phosphohydrolase [Longimicrobium sp.]HSU13762.1 HD domain-containing phosphohydrolase [Longimicrobium sp.]
MATHVEAQLAAGTPPEDPVLSLLDAAAEAYRMHDGALRGELAMAQADARSSSAEAERWRAEAQSAEADAESLRGEVRAVRSELEGAHLAFQRQRERAETLRHALVSVHRALFGGNVYEMILRACMQITGATRGLYISSRAGGRMRVRAAHDVDGYPDADPSPFICALSRRVIDRNEPVVCNDGTDNGVADIPAPTSDGERFRNLVVSPVVVMQDLDGVVIVGDKQGGGFDPNDVETLLSVGHHAGVAVENRRLEQALQMAYVSTVSILADAVEAKDPYTHGHCEMASRYARLVAGRMGLTPQEQAVVCYSALLHDVGKIGVSDGVLNKPGPLLPEEMELMRAHVRVGHDLLRNVPVLQPVADVVLHHHERYDGDGYPDGLRGDEIPLPARIVAVVDAYCAMITRRSYKEAYTEDHARDEIRRCAGSQFDPGVVDAFLQVLETPEADDPDEDAWAECLVLPGLADRQLLRKAS